MKVEAIQKAVDRLQVAMAAKGKVHCKAEFDVGSHVELCVYLSWYEPGKDSFSDSHSKFIRGDAAETILSEAEAFIAAFPSAEEVKFNAFMGALGKVIELGRKNDIEVDFINPLTETMKRLSENVLTDQRVAS